MPIPSVATVPATPAVPSDDARAGMPSDPRVDVVDPATEQAWNRRALAGPVLAPSARFWTYPYPAIVRGRSQRAGRGLMQARGRPDDLPLLDRDAGGGAVLVGPWMLSLSVALPIDDPRVAGAAVADSYRWLGDAFVAALDRHRIVAEALPRERTLPAPDHLAWACFAGLAPWEVVAGGRKLVGFAQRRARHGVLLVAGLLLAPVPWQRMAATLGRPPGEADELAAATIDAEALTGRPLEAASFAATLAPSLPALEEIQPTSVAPGSEGVAARSR